MFDFTNVNGGAYAYVANPYSVVPPPVDKLKNKVDRFNPPRDILNEGWGNCWVLFDQRFTGPLVLLWCRRFVFLLVVLLVVSSTVIFMITMIANTKDSVWLFFSFCQVWPWPSIQALVLRFNST